MTDDTCPIPNCGFPATVYVVDGCFLCQPHAERLKTVVRETILTWIHGKPEPKDAHNDTT